MLFIPEGKGKNAIQQFDEGNSALSIEAGQQFSGGKAGGIVISAFERLCEFLAIQELCVCSDTNAGNTGPLLERPARRYTQRHGIIAGRYLTGLAGQTAPGNDSVALGVSPRWPFQQVASI